MKLDWACTLLTTVAALMGMTSCLQLGGRPPTKLKAAGTEMFLEKKGPEEDEFTGLKLKTPITEEDSSPSSMKENILADDQSSTTSAYDTDSSSGAPSEEPSKKEEVESADNQLPGMPPKDQSTPSSQNDASPDLQGGGAAPIHSVAAHDVGLTIATDSPQFVPGPSPSEIETSRRNYLVAAVNLNEAAQFISSAGPSNPFQAYSSTQVAANIKLAKDVRRFHTNLDYKGGVTLNRDSGSPFYGHTVQQLTAVENIPAGKTNFTLEDSITDAPGATFGSTSFGGAAAYNLDYNGGSSTSDFLGFTDFGAFPKQRLTDVALAQVTHSFTPQTGITVVGAYSLTQYFNASMVNSQLFSSLVSYNHDFTARSHISALYGYQYWKFPGGFATTSQTTQAVYSHQFSPRLNVSAAAGPQLSTSASPLTVIIANTQIPIVLRSRQLGLSAEGVLSYGLRRGAVGFSYQHYVTSGSGLFAGAQSDFSSVSLTQDIWPRWATDFSGGFVRLESLGNRSSAAVQSIYQYWFVGAGVRRSIGRHFSLVGSYQLDDSTKLSVCAVSSSCGGVTHTLLMSLSWHTLPIRLERGFAEVESAPVAAANEIP